MTGTTDVRVRAHTTFSVDTHQKPRTRQLAAGLTEENANELAEAIAARHDGAYHAMTTTETDYPADAVPGIYHAVYRELMQVGAGARITFQVLPAKTGVHLVVEKNFPVEKRSAAQPKSERVTLDFRAAPLLEEIGTLIRGEISKLKPTLDKLTRESTRTEVRQAIERAVDKMESVDIEVLAHTVAHRTGKAIGELETMIHDALADVAKHRPLAEAPKERYAAAVAGGMTPERARALHLGAKTVSVEGDPYIDARIAWLKANPPWKQPEPEEKDVHFAELSARSGEEMIRASIRTGLRRGLSGHDCTSRVIQAMGYADMMRPTVQGYVDDEIRKILKRPFSS